MAEYLDYRNKLHVKHLAAWIRNVGEDEKVRFATFVIDKNLMRAEWSVRVVLWIYRKRFGTTYAAWNFINDRNPDVCRALVDATARHVEFGKDQSTKDAAGGLNGPETAKLVHFLAWNVDRPTV